MYKRQIERLANKLSGYLIQHQKSIAEENQWEALTDLESVLDVIGSLDGSEEDGPKVQLAAEELANQLDFNSVEMPEAIDESRRVELVGYIQKRRVEALEAVVGWRTDFEFAVEETKEQLSAETLNSQAGLASMVMFALVNAFDLGGLTGAALILSPVFVVLKVVLSTLRTNFRPATPESDPEE